MRTHNVVALFIGMFATTMGLALFIDYTSKQETDIASKSRPLELGEIENSQAKQKIEKSVIFNDPAMSEAWGIKKTDAQRAWEISQGSRKIVVAVIDTGIDADHEDLKNNLWTNPKEIAGNGKDDDGNGYIDDIHGWNFVSNNSNLNDNHGHGSHIAGIIGAVGGNNKGIIGVAPQVSMMILKYYDPKVPNTNNLQNTINSLKYAVDQNVDIINYSGGGTSFSQQERELIEKARQKGILFVAAAGNEKSNSDIHKYYPADYDLENIISVTAVDQTTRVLSSSNWGTTTVDIAAPGQNILSTLPGNNYGYMTGTSQATAFATGAAVLIMAKNPSFRADDVKKHILSTGDSDLNLVDKIGTSRKLNLYKALTVLDQGISATGIIAVNTMNMKNQFTNTPSANGNLNGMAEFSRSLLKTVNQNNN